MNSVRRKKIRPVLAQRDGAQCFYCRTPFGPEFAGATIDHYLPHSLWPKSRVFNLVLACEPCNSAKADALPLTLAWLLLRLAPLAHTDMEVAA